MTRIPGKFATKTRTGPRIGPPWPDFRVATPASRRRAREVPARLPKTRSGGRVGEPSSTGRTIIAEGTCSASGWLGGVFAPYGGFFLVLSNNLDTSDWGGSPGSRSRVLACSRVELDKLRRIIYLVVFSSLSDPRDFLCMCVENPSFSAPPKNGCKLLHAKGIRERCAQWWKRRLTRRGRDKRNKTNSSPFTSGIESLGFYLYVFGLPELHWLGTAQLLCLSNILQVKRLRSVI